MSEGKRKIVDQKRLSTVLYLTGGITRYASNSRGVGMTSAYMAQEKLTL